MITWEIVALERKATDGGVIKVHFCATKVDGEHTGVLHDDCRFRPDSSSEGYTPFDQLTQDDVIGWLQAKYADGLIEQILDERIAESKAPSIVDGVPW